MKLLSVGLIGTTDDIRAKLQQDCSNLKQEGFRVAIDEINKGNYTFLGCNVIEGELSFRNYERIKNLLKNYVAKILAELIILREEKRIIRKIIEHNYYYFSEEEQNAVYDNTIKSLDSSNDNASRNFGRTIRHNTVLSKLVDYLDNHHELVLEGFINFRLKEYRERLVEIVDNTVDDFMMDLEYKEFIRVLRYFVDIQEPQVEEVHVVITESGKFKILDIDGKAINNLQYKFIYDSDINYEDLLITALITISPYNVMIHSSNPTGTQGMIETIKSIFEGRVAVCDGCSICSKKK